MYGKVADLLVSQPPHEQSIHTDRRRRSTGDKASKWSGASGPQNVFYRKFKAMTVGALLFMMIFLGNYMLKAVRA